jgi:hypothetical protein
MTTLTKILFVVLGLAIIGLGVAYFTQTPAVVKEVVKEIGVAPGTDHYNTERFWGGFGGNVLATTSAGATTVLTEGLLQQYSVFSMNATLNFTYTLPATTTLTTLLKNAGDTQRWLFTNASTSTGSNLTLAKGTGWNLVGYDNDDDVIAGAAWGSQVWMTVDCTKQADKDIVCLLSENIAVD